MDRKISETLYEVENPIYQSYEYGQGLFGANQQLFVTPKELSPAKYNISVSLDIDKNIYSGTETIIWENQSPLPIGRLRIDRGAIAESNLVIEEINGSSPDDYNLLYHENFILIDLPSSINCGEKFTFKAKFTAELPKSRFHEGDIFEFDSWVAWYPKLYWDEPIGSTCQVTFESITDGYQIFAVGEKSGDTYYESHIANYYGFAASKKMTAISAEVRGITATIVHYPEYAKCAEFMLETAVGALDFFVDFIGLYPYKSFTVIPGSSNWSGGGNFSSGIVFVHNFESYDPENQEYIEYYKALIPHEIGHQYFWEYVLENERPDWLGLGLSIALDREYSEYKLGVKSFHKRMMDKYIEYVNKNKNTTLTLPEEEAKKALGGEDNEYGDNFHGNICHGKSFSIMSMLIDIMGKDRYFSVMRHILKNYGGKVLYTPDYIRLCEEFSGMSLNWFFDQWLKSNKRLSYSLENITETEANGIYTVNADVCRKDFLFAPVCVAAYYEDGSHRSVFTERLLNRQALTFTSESKHTKIIFDPYEAYAMKKSGEEIIGDCAELLIQNIKETGYEDPLDVSLEYYERFKKFAIDDYGTKRLLCMQLFDSRHYNECVEICEDIIRDKKTGRYNMANAYRWIGMCRDITNEREKAIEAYQKALSFEDVQFGDRHDQ